MNQYASSRAAAVCVAALLASFTAPQTAFAICTPFNGDITGNGEVNVADVMCNVLANLWSLAGATAAPPSCLSNYAPAHILPDHNCDKIVNVADTLISTRFALGLPLPLAIDANADQCVDKCQIDTDGDGYGDFGDCMPYDPNGHWGAVEVCNGADDDCDGQIDEQTEAEVNGSCANETVCDGLEVCSALVVPAGGVSITELMVDPASSDDAVGEWVELTNLSNQTFNLNGWKVGPPGALHKIQPGGALFLSPGASILLGRNTDSAVNGGLDISYAWSGFELSNDGGVLEVRTSADELVDSVLWGVAPVGASVAMVRPDADGMQAASWAVSTHTMPSGDRGTPLGPNFDVAQSICLGGTSLECDDANDCTDDGCDAVLGCTNSANTVPCDDGDACTTADECAGGTCGGGPALVCDDGNVCTDDWCEAASGCEHAPNFEACDDGNACTAGDSCVGGSCGAGGAVVCDDGNGCTDDACDPASGCVATANSSACEDGDACTLGDVCVGGACASGSPAECDDGNVCTDDGCDSATGCIHANNGAGCDDGNACTTTDVCASGACVGSGAPNCDDGNLCTTDACNPSSGCTHTDNTVACDDGSACTVTDACAGGTCVGTGVPNCNDGNGCTDDGCNPATGCTHTNNTVACNDGNACTVTDVCSAGNCVGSGAPNCEDGNVCTNDACNPSSGCTHTNNTVVCNDGDACTLTDVCSAGSCVGSGAPNCDDGNVCTDDGCNSSTGCTQTNNTVGCNDGNACTVTDVCSGGSCVGSGTPNCDDGNVCTTDSCNTSVGCTHATNSVGCNDGNACTVTDVCSGGSCVGSGAPNCNDGNACTDDVCNPPTGCAHANNTSACNDGNACTVTDVCSGGSCVGSGAPNCDDGNGCTDDACNPSTGCTHTNNSAACNDGNACTVTDVCSGGSCVGSGAPNCNDGNGCTNDACNPATGCTYTNNTAACDDSNACTVTDVCSSGSCVGSGAPNCNDGNVCTNDACNPPTGCTHTNNTTACNDGNACTVTDVCSAGSCVGSGTPNCNDGNVCTNDACNPATGCTHSNNTTACNDNNACTVTDVCSGGSCVGSGAPNCNDGNACTDDACNPSTGCTHSNNAAACNDGNACTVTDSCSGGSCVGSGAPTCNDGNLCTNDGCNPSTGCTYTNNTAACNDGNACTVTDVCSGGSCVGSGSPNCNDGKVCTTDNCNPSTGCTNTNNSTACNDGNACTVTDTCSGGTCVGSGSPNCNDGNVCTNDSCNPASGCTHGNVANGTVCAAGAVCSGGVCTPTGGCFEAGTWVTTDEGLVPIEKISAGQLVLSWSETAREQVWAEVEKLEVEEPEPLYAVTLTTGEVVRATASHYFWVHGSGWVRVRELQAGDELRSPDLERAEVESVRGPYATTDPVYNLAVEGTSTYFVGADPLLVHSCEWTLNVTDPGGPAEVDYSSDEVASPAPGDVANWLVFHGMTGQLSLVDRSAPSGAARVDIPCVGLGPWSLLAGTWEDSLVVVDVSDFAVDFVSLDTLRGIAAGVETCERGTDRTARRVPLASREVPYMAHIDADTLYLSYFGSNRVEAYAMEQPVGSVAPDARLAWSWTLPAGAPTGISDVLAHDGVLFAAAAAFRCGGPECPSRFGPAGVLSLGAAGADAEVTVWPTSGLNATGLYRHQATGRTYVLAAGDLVDGAPTIERIEPSASPALGTAIRLPSNARTARAFPVTDAVFAALPFGGDHLFLVDAQRERLAAIRHFDGVGFQDVALNILRVPDRTDADVQALVPSGQAGRYLLLDSKGEQLVEVTMDDALGRWQASRRIALRRGDEPSAPSWLVPLR